MAEETIEPKKTLFIVKAKTTSLQNAESWLAGKGWSIESTIHIKEALPKILSSNPTYIILCMDHPNTRIRMLPKLFEQAFQRKVIGYLEHTSPSSLAAISGMDYVLYPPVSGTSIDRMTAKLERDRKRKQELDEQRGSGVGKASLGTTDTGVIAIKGGAQQEADSAVVAQQAKQALMQMLGNESPVARDGSSNNEAHTHLSSMTSSQPNSGAATGTGAGSSTSGAKSGASSTMPVATSGGHSHQKNKSAENLGVTVDHLTRETKGRENHAPLLEVTQRAIQEVADSTPNTTVHRLQSCSEAICFFVKSERHRGFVICTIAHNQDPLQKLVEMFKSKIDELMKEFDDNFLTSQSFEVRLSEVNFDEWTQSQATFSKKFIHQGHECGVAFFELHPPNLELGPSARQDMVKMNLADIYQGRRVPFDVFLHLPINNKYILYNRRGSLFYDNQKTRLLSKGVANVHLYEIEIQFLERYHFETFLNQKISEHLETMSKRTHASS